MGARRHVLGAAPLHPPLYPSPPPSLPTPPPQVKDTPDAPAKAREELRKLGPLSLDEKLTAGALGLTVALWIFGGALGINAVAAALLGLAIMLVTNVVTWKECLSDNQARQDRGGGSTGREGEGRVPRSRAATLVRFQPLSSPPFAHPPPPASLHRPGTR